MKIVPFLLLIPLPIFADANCVGNKPCYVDGAGDSVATADSVSTSDAGAESVSNSSSDVDIIHPDDIKIKNTPSIGLGTPAGSAGVGIAFPGGGLSLNLPLDRAFTRLQGFVDMGMPEAGITDYCSSKRRAKPFGGTSECAEMLSKGLAVAEPVIINADASEDHEKLENRIKELEEKLEEQKVRERGTKRQVDVQEQRRREALKQLENMRG